MLKFIDVITGILSGAAVAWAVCKAVSPEWGMFLAMLGGMTVGMIVCFILMVFLVPPLGAFEVMIPLHNIGMWGGMIAGMSRAAGISEPAILLTGASTGFAISLLVLISDYGHKPSPLPDFPVHPPEAPAP